MTVTILQGDCRDVLKTLPGESVHCVVTSPPYWGLRDYKIPPSIWGGDPRCDHMFGSKLPPRPGRGNKPGDVASSGLTNPERQDTIARPADAGSFCIHCHAWRGTLGLEPTYQLYVEHIVEVFREVRRVLREDGTLWLNLGDSYASQGGPGWQGKNGQRADRRFTLVRNTVPMREASRCAAHDLKPKDLCGMPWRVAFALQEDGWYLRQDIIWAKPNPMPESVRDRCTKAHEYIFLLSKNERYHYDANAIAERATFAGKVVTLGEKSLSVGQANGANVAKSGNALVDSITVKDTRNRRSVWEVATQPFSGAHFATFPPALIEPCILAGCPLGGTALDPFFGAGTTGLVADRLGRNCVGIELNPEYVAMAERRIKGDAGMFAEVISP